MTVLTFWPALDNDFVNWDDPGTVLKNTHCHGLDTSRLTWMFSTFYWGHYQPLVWLSYAADYAWSRLCFGEGLVPAAYHVTSSVLHALNAALLYLLALKLLRLAELRRGHDAGRRPSDIALAPPPSDQPRPWGLPAAAILASLLFALHPLRVEAVAWVTGRGDVLVAFFLLLTVLAYLRAVLDDRRTHYVTWLVIACFLYAASLLTRAMAVTLPIILLLLDWYPLRRFQRSPRDTPAPPRFHIWLEKTPFLLLAAAAAILAPLAKTSASATVDLIHHGPVERLAQACYGLVFYVWKTLVPLTLSPIYELRMPIELLEPRYLASLSVVLSGAVVLLFLVLRRRASAVACAATAYIVLISPVLGLVQSGSQEVADRYCYLAALPLALLAAGGLKRALQTRRTPEWAKVSFGAAACGFVGILAVLAWQQCGVWHDSFALWSHAAHISPDSSIALSGYGCTLVEQKRYEEAEPVLRCAIALQPANEKAHRSLWSALQGQGKSEELLEAYRESIRTLPASAEVHYSLGNELLARGQNMEAALEYRLALSLNPGDSRTHANLGKALRRQRNFVEALREYELAVQADPQNVIARHGVALLLYEHGRTAEASEHIREALRLDPNYEPIKTLLTACMNEENGSP